MSAPHDGKVALITGAAGGIGTALVNTMAADGATVVGLDMNEFANDAAAKTYTCDLTDFLRVRSLLDEIEAKFGSIRILINNAGYFSNARFFELGMDQVAHTFAVNVTAPLYLCQQVSPSMRDNGGGAIVNVASIAGRGGSSQVDYGASKAAVINFTISLARVLAKHHIRINAVAPGLVDAGMGVRIGSAFRDSMLTQTPLKRGANPEEIANLVSFLASDKASYVTGETVYVHGGL